MDQTSKILLLPEPRYLNIHRWTNEEKVFKRKEKILQEIQDLDISFRTALLNKLSRSVFGTFLEELNEKQSHCSGLNQNKMQILQWEFKRYTDHDLQIINKRNTVFPDYFELLKKAVNTRDIINLSFLEACLDNLSLNCCLVKEVDDSLRNFIHIQVLNLCGNYIKDIAGEFLPRNLKFLELFDNLISDLKNLVKYAPKTIMHLGLGRNRLTNDSNLHLLTKRKTFYHLKSLDISDNDIYDLTSVLNSLKNVSHLEALSLEGNQCSVTPGYKNNVLMCFPKLKFLDFTKILHTDYINIKNKMEKELLPHVMFKCYRIMGLQEPPKDQKTKQVFYLEINFPLLIENPVEIIEMKKESVHFFDEIHDDTTSKESDKSLKINKNMKSKEKNKRDKPRQSELDLKKGKKKAYFLKENEYNRNFEKHNVWCKTERLSWSKIMEFPPIFISAPDNNLQIIRDTFRSIVPVRIIYVKTAPFSAKDKKNQEKQKKDKDAKKATKETTNTSTQELECDAEEDQTEMILKKITVASFYCDLKSLNWSDETVDFYWADHSEIGDTALRVNGSLKAIDYDVSLDPKKAKQRLLKPKENGEIEGPTKEALPTVLTCQVGFGLNRY